MTWEKKYTGFAHGNSGIMYSLVLANEVINDSSLQNIILLALNYEKKHRIAEGWQDMRVKDKILDFNSWCHGATGILMTRKAILSESTKLDKKIIEAVNEDIHYYNNTSTKRKGNIHPSLCHGFYGNFLIENRLENIKKMTKNIVFDLENPAEEKSIMTGKLGWYYAFFKSEFQKNDLPDILLLT
nr:lanthionine synthetase LanC family protein [Bacillus cereus]